MNQSHPIKAANLVQRRSRTHEWSDSWGEDGAALNDKGHPCSHHNGDVAGNPAEGEGEVCRPNRDAREQLKQVDPNQSRARERLFLSFLHHHPGQTDLEVGRRRQEGCTCVAHPASPQGRCADYQTGCRSTTSIRHVLSSYLCSAPSWWPPPPGPSGWSWAAWRWGWGRNRGWTKTTPTGWGPRPGLAAWCWWKGGCLSGEEEQSHDLCFESTFIVTAGATDGNDSLWKRASIKEDELAQEQHLMSIC